MRDVVERRIRDAQEQGKFRDLAGKGKPQDIQDNPFEDPEMRLAYKILSNAGFAPPWVELSNEIEADLQAAERVWEHYRSQRRRQMDAVHRSSVTRFAELVTELDAARDRVLDRLLKRWSEVNRKIAHFNATVPSESLQKRTVSVQRERRKFELEFPLLAGYLRDRPSPDAGE
ncbi:MAG: DUF1992 domain-containing protein [Chloroflexota bacterium]|nr:DUF1992 domain-containing protein [Chloroflexota bacterium]